MLTFYSLIPKQVALMIIELFLILWRTFGLEQPGEKREKLASRYNRKLKKIESSRHSS